MGFGLWWQELVSTLGKEGKGIIPIVEEELASREIYEEYEENTVFIQVRVGAAKQSLAIRKLKEAGYPVREITVSGKEATGRLFSIAGFATLLRGYLMGISPTMNGMESSLAKAVRYQLEKMRQGGALGLEITENEPFSEYPVRQKGSKDKVTQVIAFHADALFDIEHLREASPSGMNVEFKVKPRSIGVFNLMGRIAEEGNPIAFVSSEEGVTREVMEQMLRDYMCAYGLSPEVVGKIVNKELIIDRKTLEENRGIVGISRTQKKISAEAVFSIIAEKLLGRTYGNGIKVNIITHDEGRWKKEGRRDIMERILWVVLKPEKEGEILSTAAGLAVAIEGKVSMWLREFIKVSYSEEEAARLLSEIEQGNGRIILPATRVDEEYLKRIQREERIYKAQA
jgi:hypothetical protein